MILPGYYFGYQQILAEELVERSTLEEEAELEHYSIESTLQIYLTSKNSNFLSCDQKGEGMGFGFHDEEFRVARRDRVLRDRYRHNLGLPQGTLEPQAGERGSRRTEGGSH